MDTNKKQIPNHLESGLLALHTDMAAKISYYRQEINKLKETLAHIDATLKHVNPELDLRSIRTKQYRTSSNGFKPNELARLIFDVMREQKEPMTSAEILAAVLKLPKLTQKQSSGLNIKSITAQLRALAKKSQVSVKPNENNPKIMQWSLL